MKGDFINGFNDFGCFFTGLGNIFHGVDEFAHGFVGILHHVIDIFHQTVRMNCVIRIFTCHGGHFFHGRRSLFNGGGLLGSAFGHGLTGGRYLAGSRCHLVGTFIQTPGDACEHVNDAPGDEKGHENTQKYGYRSQNHHRKLGFPGGIDHDVVCHDMGPGLFADVIQQFLNPGQCRHGLAGVDPGTFLHAFQGFLRFCFQASQVCHGLVQKGKGFLVEDG